MLGCPLRAPTGRAGAGLSTFPNSIMKKLIALFALIAAVAAYAQETEVIAPKDLSKKPSPVKKVDPTGVSVDVKAMVVVEIVIGKDGTVIDAKIKKSNNPDCEPACLDAIRQWQFAPGEKDGAPVATRLLVPFRFGTEN